MIESFKGAKVVDHMLYTFLPSVHSRLGTQLNIAQNSIQ